MALQDEGFVTSRNLGERTRGGAKNPEQRCHPAVVTSTYNPLRQLTTRHVPRARGKLARYGKKKKKIHQNHTEWGGVPKNRLWCTCFFCPQGGWVGFPSRSRQSTNFWQGLYSNKVEERRERSG